MLQPCQVFKAFADETRLRILSLLAHGEMCVSDLDGILQVGQSKVSRHLDYLRKNALVTSRRAGTLMMYRLDLEDQTPEHQILMIWTAWGQQTATGRRDHELHQSLLKRA